jgi:hypothetical protein
MGRRRVGLEVIRCEGGLDRGIASAYMGDQALGLYIL